MATEAKKWYQSKLIWLGWAAVGTAATDFITNFEADTWGWQTVTLFAVGLVTVLFRAYGTSTAIE